MYRVSIKSLYNLKNLVAKANERTDKWKSLQNETYTFKFFLFASFDTPLYCIEHIVYRTKVRDITNLKQRITDAIATIDEGMLRSEHGKKSSTV